MKALTKNNLYFSCGGNTDALFIKAKKISCNGNL